MNTRRLAKAAEAIRETVSSTVLFGLRDPRIQNVTVLGAEVSPDLRSAKVFVSVMGDVKTQSLSMHGLNAARGFIQSKIADRLQTKNTPILQFVLDPSVKRSIETSRLLREAGIEPGSGDSDVPGEGIEGEDEINAESMSDPVGEDDGGSDINSGK